MESMLKLKYGTSNQITNSSPKEGQLIVSTDDGSLYYDHDDNTRFLIATNDREELMREEEIRRSNAGINDNGSVTLQSESGEEEWDLSTSPWENEISSWTYERFFDKLDFNTVDTEDGIVSIYERGGGKWIPTLVAISQWMFEEFNTIDNKVSTLNNILTDGVGIRIYDGRLYFTPKNGGTQKYYTIDEIFSSFFTFLSTSDKKDINNSKNEGWLPRLVLLIQWLGNKYSALNEDKADKATTLAEYGIEDAYTKEETDIQIEAEIANASHLKREIVSTLPTTGEDNVIYMVSNGGSGDQRYDEYMYINNAFEKIGDTSVKLNDYYSSEEIDGFIKTLDNKKANKGTSLNEYGITDAYTKTQVDNKVQEISDELQNFKGEKVYTAKEGYYISSITFNPKDSKGVSQTGVIQIEEKLLPPNVVADNAGNHNSIYRGKYLGDSVTEEQYSAISSGTFEDLFIGDYWTINDVNYRIAAFDYYFNCGQYSTTNHHIVMVPDTSFYSAAMDSSRTNVGYKLTELYETGMSDARTTIQEAFSGHILRHYIWVVSQLINGAPVAGNSSWESVVLMTEQMVWGSRFFSTPQQVSQGACETTQLPLFAFDRSKINTRDLYWLRDTYDEEYFSVVDFYGGPGTQKSSDTARVRPCFCIY